MILALIQACLLSVALFSPTTVSYADPAIAHLWSYAADRNATTRLPTTYALAPYGTAVLIVGCLLLICFAYFAYAWYREEMRRLPANKAAWAGALGGSLAFMAVCAIVGMVAASIVSGAYPQRLSPDAVYANAAAAAGVSGAIAPGTPFGLAFTVGGVTSSTANDFAFTLAPSPFGAFAGAMQILLLFSSLGWGCAFCLSFSKVPVPPREKKEKRQPKAKPKKR